MVRLPQPTTVRDPDTGQIVDGYQVTVRSTVSGAVAQLEIPKDRYSADYLQAQAQAALGPLDHTIARFGADTLTGANGSSGTPSGS